jgi:hypothetical protein
MYRRHNYRYEGKVLRKADNITVTTIPTQLKYLESFPHCHGRIHVVNPLLIMPPTIQPDNPLQERLRLIYVGTLHKSIRSPANLLDLFNSLLQTRLGSQLELHFYGNLHDCSAFFEPYHELIGKTIFLHGVRPRVEVLRAMQEAHVLINIGNRTEYQLPSKLVEYVASTKPIINLAISKEDSSYHFLRGYPAFFSWVGGATANPDDHQFQELISFINCPPRVDASQVSSFLADYQIDVIARKYEALAGTDR